jgi:uncharacterized SAM-binding protein YcdF (DUF218 family)
MIESLRSDINTVLSFLSLSTYQRSFSSDIEIIFLFGHYEPMIARHAASLWHSHRQSFVLVSGKGRDKIPEGYTTEAAYYTDILIQSGVPSENIIGENRATNTLENILFGVSEARDVLGAFENVVLCALPPLLRRTEATFRKQFPEVSIFTSAFPLPDDWWTKKRVVRFMQEIDRMDEYGRKGDMCIVDIPEYIRVKALRVMRDLNGA